MITIWINNEFACVLTAKSEPRLIDHIKKQIAKGKWTPETPIQAIEDGEVIDSGKIEDFFNIN